MQIGNAKAPLHSKSSILFVLLTSVVCLIAMPCTALANEADDLAQQKFFESHVRPLLLARCVKCHGPGKQEGELRLDSRAAMLHGGESGAAIVPGDSAESLLVQAINYESYEMPPEEKLKDSEIALLERWVAMGAYWPTDKDGRAVAIGGANKFTEEDKSYWFFQPVVDPALPILKNDSWSRNEIDHYILKQLQEANLTPAPQADKRTLIRRVYYDLLGLPPSPGEIEEFVADDSPAAYANLIDRLLESPRYGERWARHWLDVVRYAESDGFRADFYRPSAWRYRDYVIDAFNQDKPYDQFVREQLAGDELAPHDPDAIIATGYLRLWLYEYNQRDARTQWSDILNNVTDVTSEAFLGLSMGCARCHDHKFDAILQKDYYRLRAYFAAMLPRDDIPAATPEQRLKYETQLANWEAKTEKIRTQIAEIEAPFYRKAEESAVEKFPPEIQRFMYLPALSRSPSEHQIADLVNRQVLYEHTRGINPKGEQKTKVDRLKKELAEFAELKPAALPSCLSVTDVGPIAPQMTIPGNADAENILPGVISILDKEPAKIAYVPTAPQSTGRRTALAKWMTSPENPLTTRVIVNRIWQHHFGQGLVSTPNDFGRLGQRPSHPELLDWLTTQFLDEGWRFKPLHRKILLSATYQQSSSHPTPAVGEMKDPGNRLRWRFDVRRLDAEQVRDAMLATSGKLDLKTGGPSVNSDTPRRSIYLKVIRNSPVSLLDSFDVADGFSSFAKRNVTTTATQALLMMNGKQVYSQAEALAKRIRQAPEEDWISESYELILGRKPTSEEQAETQQWLQQLAETRAANGKSALDGLVDLCHVLLNSNEFLYVD